jgi:hypothetical protein
MSNHEIDSWLEQIDTTTATDIVMRYYRDEMKLSEFEINERLKEPPTPEEEQGFYAFVREKYFDDE